MGLVACLPSFCPFAFILLPSFSSLYLLFVLRLVCFVLVVFCLSSCLVCFCVLVVFVVVSFSLADYTQKRKGAKVLPLVSSLRLLYVA